MLVLLLFSCLMVWLLDWVFPLLRGGAAAAPSGGESGDGSDDGPKYTADQLLDFESEASAIAAEFLAQF